MASTTAFDVVIVGAGSIGMMTAFTLKMMNINTRICVIDKNLNLKNEIPMMIRAEAIDRLINPLQVYFMAYSHLMSHTAIQTYLNSCRDKTIELFERSIATHLENIGVNVYRGPSFEVTEDNLPVLLDDQIDLLSEEPLKDIFRNAKVVIGADGQESVVRKVCMKNMLTLGNTSGAYRSEISVKRLDNNKCVFLLGDAESRVKIEEGFNNGLKRVAESVKVIKSLLESRIPSPSLLETYQNTVSLFYSREMSLVSDEAIPPPNAQESSYCQLL